MYLSSSEADLEKFPHVLQRQKCSLRERVVIPQLVRGDIQSFVDRYGCVQEFDLSGTYRSLCINFRLPTEKCCLRSSNRNSEFIVHFGVTTRPTRAKLKGISVDDQDSASKGMFEQPKQVCPAGCSVFSRERQWWHQLLWRFRWTGWRATWLQAVSSQEGAGGQVATRPPFQGWSSNANQSNICRPRSWSWLTNRYRYSRSALCTGRSHGASGQQTALTRLSFLVSHGFTGRSQAEGARVCPVDLNAQA